MRARLKTNSPRILGITKKSIYLHFHSFIYLGEGKPCHYRTEENSQKGEVLKIFWKQGEDWKMEKMS